MRVPVLPAILLLVLGACAARTTDRLPVCDGLARRPANPQGSVLSPPAPVSSLIDTDARDAASAVGNGGGCA